MLRKMDARLRTSGMTGNKNWIPRSSLPAFGGARGDQGRGMTTNWGTATGTNLLHGVNVIKDIMKRSKEFIEKLK